MSRSYLTNHGMSDKRVTACLKETSKITALFDIHGHDERINKPSGGPAGGQTLSLFNALGLANRC